MVKSNGGYTETLIYEDVIEGGIYAFNLNLDHPEVCKELMMYALCGSQQYTIDHWDKEKEFWFLIFLFWDCGTNILIFRQIIIFFNFLIF